MTSVSLRRNIVANLVGRAVSMGSVYLFLPFYVKTLGVERYGVVAFYAILLTLASLADAGLSSALSREAARDPDRGRLRILLATIERILLATALVFALGTIIAADGIARYWLNAGGQVDAAEVATSIRLMGLMIVPQLGISMYVAGLMGLERQATANLTQVALTIARNGLVIPLLYVAPSLSLFFGWQLAITVLFFLIARAVLLRALGYGAFDIRMGDLAVLRPVMGFAGGMFAITLIAAANTQMDKLVVSRLFSLSDFGSYSLVGTLAQLPSVVVGPMLVAMLPRLTRMVTAGDAVGADALFVRFSRIAAGLSACGALGLILFAPEVLNLWLGSNQVMPAAVNVLRVLALGGLFLALNAPPFYFGLAYGHNRTSVVVGVVALVIAFPLLIVGGMTFGLIGAAWPWVLVNAMQLVALLAVVVRRYFGGSMTHLILSGSLKPLMIVGISLCAARLAADMLQTSLFATIILAGAAAAFGLLCSAADELKLFVRSRRLARL